MSYVIRIKYGLFWKRYRCLDYRIEGKIRLGGDHGAEVYDCPIKPWLVMQLVSGRVKIISHIDDKDWEIDSRLVKQMAQQQEEALLAPARPEERLLGENILQ